MFILRQEWVKHIFSRPEEFPRTEFLTRFFPLLGNGLLTSVGDQHRFQKRILSKAFSNQQLQTYVPIFDKHAENFVKVFFSFNFFILLFVFFFSKPETRPTYNMDLKPLFYHMTI